MAYSIPTRRKNIQDFFGKYRQTLVLSCITKYSFRKITPNYISSQNIEVRLYDIHACSMRKGNPAVSELLQSVGDQNFLYCLKFAFFFSFS